jgi:broad specificity phosphatase PhoE
MPRILLVRHGQAAGTFTDDLDPGLSELGWSQAEIAATALTPEMPMKIISSPLKRAQETAVPLARAFDIEPVIEERIAELPSVGMSLEERGPWIRGVMQSTWSAQSTDLNAWRQRLLDCLLAQQEDCIMFSHFVAINVATAAAMGSDAVTVFRPDNASITELCNDVGELALVRRGDEAETKVN